MSNTNLVARLAARYRKRFPYLKFRVKRKRMPTMFGYCQQTEDGFLVVLDSTLSQEYAIFVLPHEIAHAISFHADDIEHGDNFWTTYRKTYEVYEEFLDSIKEG